ncbi:hypothetical protein PVK06_025438 [Gossypium arboreum]|uniref:Uncharacterized protein n=1 Tax=Gossypium arboreum TaxID=29729 RepID=A0ABR0PGK9_GOSAR|nr:hypothetical protein PVK06_025438 [Gossypium arboreum]
MEFVESNKQDMGEWVDLKTDDSFSKATIEQHLNQFKSIIRQYGAEFEAKLQEFDLIPNPDIQKLLRVEIGDDSEQVSITKLEDGDVVEPMEPESIDKYIKVNNNERTGIDENGT